MECATSARERMSCGIGVDEDGRRLSVEGGTAVEVYDAVGEGGIPGGEEFTPVVVGHEEEEVDMANGKIRHRCVSPRQTRQLTELRISYVRA